MSEILNQTMKVLFIGGEELHLIRGNVHTDEVKINGYSKRVAPDAFRHGSVLNLEKASAAIKSLLSEMGPVNSEEPLYVVVDNGQLKTFVYSSSQYFQGEHRAINASDVSAVIDQTRTVATLPLTEHILQAIPASFLVNDLAGVQNPLGLEATRLGVTLNLFTMNYQDYQNMAHAFEAEEVEVDGYYSKIMTLPEAVLNQEEKQQGALVVDLHEDYAHLILWKNGAHLASTVIPYSGAWLTQKIASEWNIEPRDAAKIKQQYGSLNLTTEYSEELVPLIERQGVGKNQIRRAEFQEIFIPYVYDWLSQIWTACDQLTDSNSVKYPHYVFTGPAACIDGLMEFVQRRFSRVVRLGLTRKIDASQELLLDPKLSGALGLFRWIANHGSSQQQFAAPKNLIHRTLASAKDWFLNYF